MPLRNAHVVTFRPHGVTDSIDGTNNAPGVPQAPTSLSIARDIVPSMHTAMTWVPRPAAKMVLDFSSFAQPTSGEALVEIGNRAYGFVASNRFPGHSEPFVYDFSIGGFVPINGVTAANTPVSTAPTGDWIPPTITRVGAWTLFTHPGFSLPNAFGWLDQTNFSDTATGDTGFNTFGGVWGTGLWGTMLWGGTSDAGGTVISNLSKNVFSAGWRPGQTITDSGGAIQVGTVIEAISVDGLSIRLSQTTTGPAIRGDTLTVKGGTTGHPLWSAGNTNVNPLPGVAQTVALFNGRAWYSVDNADLFSDAGDPLTRSFASQAITIQNGLPITAQATIPYNNATVIGGIVNALLLFQADSGIWQITGDQATANLALNFLSPLGTLAPLTISTCPLGLFFIAPDGMRLIQLDGTVSEPISANGQGVAEPFINAQYPSRMVAAFNEDVYRVSVTGETTIGGSPITAIVSAEYWYHMKLQAWSGPHSFPAKLITQSDRAATNHGFLMFPLVGSAGAAAGIVIDSSGNIVVDSSGGIVLSNSGPLAELWFSNTRPLIDSNYIENGKQMSWAFATTLLPDTLAMFQNTMVQTSIMIGLSPPGFGPGFLAKVSAINEAGVTIQRSQISGFTPFGGASTPGSPAGIWGGLVWGNGNWGPAVAPSQSTTAGTQLPKAPAGIWGSMIWGQSLWGSVTGGAIVAQRRVPWPHPVVFKQVVVQVTGDSSPHVAIGNMYLRYQQLGYLIQDYANLAAAGMPGALGAGGGGVSP